MIKKGASCHIFLNPNHYIYASSCTPGEIFTPRCYRKRILLNLHLEGTETYTKGTFQDGRKTKVSNGLKIGNKYQQNKYKNQNSYCYVRHKLLSLCICVIWDTNNFFSVCHGIMSHILQHSYKCQGNYSIKHAAVVFNVNNNAMRLHVYLYHFIHMIYIYIIYAKKDTEYFKIISDKPEYGKQSLKL